MLKKILSFTLCIAMLTSVFIPSLPVFAEKIELEIPEDAVEYNGHYYKLYHNTKISWTDSKLECEKMGGHLVTITSQEEQNFITSLLKSAQNNSYWLGGYRAENNTWEWVTGEKFTFSNWCEGEPNNAGNRENYIHIFAKDANDKTKKIAGWNDLADAGDVDFYLIENIGFICEWELFPKAEYDSVEQYMADVIADKGYNGFYKSEGPTICNIVYEDMLEPYLMGGILRAIKEELDQNGNFQKAVLAWKGAELVFEPGSEVLKGAINSIDYYTSIILAVLDCAINDSFVPDSADNIKDTTSLITTAILEKLQLDKNKTLAELESKEWSLISSREQHEAIQALSGECDNLKRKSVNADTIFKIYEYSTGLIDFVNKVSALEEAAKLDNSVNDALEILYDSCSGTAHPEMKAALLEVKTVCNDNFEKYMTMVIDGVVTGGAIVLSDVIDGMWQSVLTTSGCGFGTGAIIGYAIGKSISNFCFSTDATIEQYYALCAMAEFEEVMISSTKKLETSFVRNKTTKNATNFLTAIRMLQNTWLLSNDYAKSYAEVALTKGLVNKIKPIFGFKNKSDYKEIAADCDSMKHSINVFGRTLLDVENFTDGMEKDDYGLYIRYRYNGLGADKFWRVKTVRVACPTDVDVYCDDEYVLSIVSDEVIGVKPGICVYVEDSVKYIILPDDMDFSVKIKGTDSGTMDYTVTEYTDAGEKKVTAFEDVPLTDGCTYDTVVDSVNEERYILTDENGQTLEPDFVSDDFVFSSEAPTLPLENNTSNDAVISVAGEMVCYTFTPSVSGNYVFYSTASDNAGVIGYVYDENLNKLREDIPNIDDNNFYININLTAGNQYIFVIRYYDSSMSGTVPFNFGNVFSIDYYYYGSQTIMSLGKKCYGIDTTLDRTVLEKDGYTFLGWSTNSTATAVEYYPGGTFSIDADTTLYAVWEENDPSVRITLDPNSNYTVNNATGTVIAKMSAKNGEGLTEFMSNITTDSERIQVTNALGAVQANVSRLTTGHEVQILGDDGNILKSYTIIILGDTDSNGRLSISDVSGVKTASAAKPEKGTVNFIEANVDGNSRLSIADASALQTFLATGEW